MAFDRGSCLFCAESGALGRQTSIVHKLRKRTVTRARYSKQAAYTARTISSVAPFVRAITSVIAAAASGAVMSHTTSSADKPSFARASTAAAPLNASREPSNCSDKHNYVSYVCC